MRSTNNLALQLDHLLKNIKIFTSHKVNQCQ